MNKQETINVVDFNNMFFSNQAEDNSRDEFNAETFFADEDLESVFEFYDRKPREQKTLTKKDIRPSRGVHEGRIYGSGHYGNKEKEERYQEWVKNFDLVKSSIYEYKNQPEVSIDEKPALDLPKENDNSYLDNHAIETRLDYTSNSIYSYMYMRVCVTWSIWLLESIFGQCMYFVPIFIYVYIHICIYSYMYMRVCVTWSIWLPLPL